MPFQSEKQRRFLHANHPEIAKRWERDYANGGILGLNESEEIISDDGNDIELTDYNAAFDDPNDLSTGVKSLFQAKDGGRIGYQWGGPGGKSPGTSSTGGMRGETARETGIRRAATSPSAPKSSPVGDYRGQHDWKFETKPGTGTQVVDIGPEREEAYVMVGGQKVPQSVWGTSTDPREKYDTEEQMLDGIYAFNIPGQTKKYTYVLGKKKSAYEQALAKQKAKMKKMGMGKLFIGLVMLLAGIPPEMVMKQVMITPSDMQKIIIGSIPVMNAKKDYMSTLNEAKGVYEELGMASHHHAVDTEIQTIDQKLLDLTRKRDEEEQPDRPEQIEVVPTGKEIEEYEGTYAMSPWDRIKANQAKRALLVEKGIIQENPIVDESVTDITMQANRGGLANLFRVKNQ